ncbi:hypothetical protein CA606_07945 [Caulobacter vibrioides]|uniref:Uncharacterized protein n=1 Tax=Caulobacter vibrioides TaxID=155892 RepID=A0A290MTM7_CAUVI|nr:hypothetical protein [Caulobacter vibrioides]ATC32287.1 hypothetical protein CA606_07945 [Caulobacter vibrioides]
MPPGGGQAEPSMAQTTRTTLRTEVRTYLIVSAGAFALGLALGFFLMG